uniref:Putative conserved secreted protein n=1 Tax=Nyssomyia neivai TaxID=330878 RepID=A0A1L8DNW1_9DIPT
MDFRKISICIFLVLLGLMGGVYGEKKYKTKDMMRKSIVFDKTTPDVFYCPTTKPSFEKLIVKSNPIHKLCEHEGKPLPPDYKSDCYQDVDESDYACKEKYRIMMRLYPPGSDAPFNGARLAKFMKNDGEMKTKISSKYQGKH